MSEQDALVQETINGPKVLVSVPDGAIFKERLQTTAKTGEIAFLTENEVHNLLQRREHLSNKRLIFPSASAPEPSITNLISDP